MTGKEIRIQLVVEGSANLRPHCSELCRKKWHLHPHPHSQCLQSRTSARSKASSSRELEKSGEIKELCGQVPLFGIEQLQKGRQDAGRAGAEEAAHKARRQVGQVSFLGLP